MSEVLDIEHAAGTFQWNEWESGTLLTLVNNEGEVYGHLRVVLAVRRYPERSLRVYCART